MGTIESSVEKNIARMEAQLKLWNGKLSELVARGKVAGQEVKIDSRKHIDELKAKLEVAHGKIAEVKKAGAGQWENFRVGVENAWKQAEAAFKKLVD